MPRAYVNGISIRYKVEGQGEPLVLIMGYSGGLIGWVFQRRAFSKHYRIITFDNRGVGKTDKPDGAYSMKMMADDTIGLMNHLGIEEGQAVQVRTSTGQVEVPVRTGQLPPGLLFMPMGPTANVLIGSDTECTGMPPSKGLMAEVEPI